jgi:ATP-dependent Clp protease adaptor protein ClpS
VLGGRRCEVRLQRGGRAEECKPYYAVQVPGGQDKTDGVVKERVKTQKQDPTLYKVVLLNDDYTTMEFVMHVLETLFQKSPAEAYRIMMQVHLNGQGIAGVYPWEVADTKVEALTSMARAAEFPLRAAIEEA